MDHEVNEPVAALVRKRMKQPVINHTENNSGRADPQRQCKYGQDRQPAVLPQAAKGVPKVAEKMFDEVSHARLPIFGLETNKARMEAAHHCSNDSGLNPV